MLGKLNSYGDDSRRLRAVESYVNKLKDVVDSIGNTDSQPIYASDYGVKGDGGEYTTELSTAIGIAYGSTRRKEVILPHGEFKINNIVKIPHQVVVRGQGQRGTLISVTSDFPAGTAMFQIGSGTGILYQEGHGITDVELSGHDGTVARADAGIHLWRANENTLIERVVIKRCLSYGIVCGSITGVYDGDLQGGSVAINFIIRDCWVLINSYPSFGGNTDSIAIYLGTGVGEPVFIENVTTNAGGGAGSYGIYANPGGNATLRITNSHFEEAEVGINMLNCEGSIANVSGHSTLDHLIAQGTTSRISILGAYKSGTLGDCVIYKYDAVDIDDRIRINDDVDFMTNNYFHIDNKGNFVYLDPRWDRNSQIFESAGGKTKVYSFLDTNGEGTRPILRRKFDNTAPVNQTDGIAQMPGYIEGSGSPVGSVNANQKGLEYYDTNASPVTVWRATARGTGGWVQIG